MSCSEIDEGKNYTGLARALELVNSNVKPVGIEELPLDLCKNVLAEASSPCWIILPLMYHSKTDLPSDMRRCCCLVKQSGLPEKHRLGLCRHCL